MGEELRKRDLVRSSIAWSAKLNHLLYVFFWLCSSHLFYCYAIRDTIRYGTGIKDTYNNRETLVSAGNRFELGFFGLAGDNGGRYFGIWYKPNVPPLTVVWVANRGSSLFSTGSFGITEDGNLKLLDDTGKIYWSTNLKISSSYLNRTVQLMDSGNLVFRDENDELGVTLWESFENPTDTFLPGMKMDENLKLTSWRYSNDPQNGSFTFSMIKQQRWNQFIVKKGSDFYWKSSEPGKYLNADLMPDAVSYLLSNFSNNVTPESYKDKRLVMNYTGKIMYQEWLNSSNKWNLLWSEPNDDCSVFNACGEFGICNSNYKRLTCKCLPGFKPSFPDMWDSENFSGGCSREAKLCGDDDDFLKLKMMKVGNPASSVLLANSETDCRKKCLENCHCQAYTFEVDHERGKQRKDTVTLSASCYIWLDYLNNLQEEFLDGGHSISVRVSLSALEPTPRTCLPCGVTIIPYPLSTGLDCGDPMYFSFRCNASTVIFKAPSGEYQVIDINSSEQKFVVQVGDLSDCGNSSAPKLQFNQSLPFNATKFWCYHEQGNLESTFPYESENKVEIGWKPPREPICTSDASCKGWPYSTCSKTSDTDGSMRCHCKTNFNWDGSSLNCTLDQGHQVSLEGPSRKTIPLFLIVVPTVLTIVILACAVISFIIWRRKKVQRQENRRSDQRNRALLKLDTERHIKDLIDSGAFKEEDENNIDVPYFDLESILAATDYFSDENKLGQGGYGPVYKGKFPGGQEIAIKRLSSVSGQGLQEFKNEVVLIAKLQHRNLVRLRGYCMKGEEKILLYEYMPNRSLDSFIFDQTRSVLLDWEMRFDIILGIARGLLYLHQDSRLRIIHRDLKTSNILLDQEMIPKISDFGLARIVGRKQTEDNTNRVVGTYGYMSPEYALEGIFSVKSDVFSFGVMLLEIISGRRNTRSLQFGQPLSLLAYAWRLWTENKVLDLVDPTLGESCKEDQFIKCVNIGLLCVQEDPSDRPNMSNVITMLDGEVANLPSPKQPAFVLRRGSTTTASSSSKVETNTEITITLEEGR